MKLSPLFAGLLCAAPALAQTPTSFAPARNAPAAPRSTAVAVTLSAPAGPGAASGLKVFSAQAGGKKSGATTVAGNTVSFTPTSPFKPGETVMATLASGAAVPQVWQFTAAATGGSGSFGSSSTLAVPYDVYCSSLADVDSDGDLDLLTLGANVQATIARSTGVVKVHLNDGRGAFTTASTIFLTPESLFGIAGHKPVLNMADVDADGDLDMLVSCYEPHVFVLINDGAGTFTLASTIAGSATSSWALVTGDVDGDGDLDYISTTRGGSSHVFTAINEIGVNNGSGSFTTRVIGPSVPILALKDVNGDGALDAVISSGSGSGFVETCLNDGSGNFGSWQPVSAIADNVAFWALDDYDGDGDLDLAEVCFVCSSCDLILKIMINNGAGSFSSNGSTVLPHSAGTSLSQLSSADANGDGRIDLLFTGWDSNGYMSDTLKVMRNMGSGNFSQPASYAVPLIQGAFASGDVDGDGDIDVVASTNAPGVNIMLNGLGVALATAAPTATSFAVWPNPASATSALHVTLATPASRATLRLATVLGQVVRTQAFSGNATIATAGLAAGVYLLTVQADGQAPLTRRVAIE